MGAVLMVEQRQRRADAGVVRQTARDAAALEWLSQMYAAPLDLVAELCGTTEHRAYALVSRWRKAGWAEAGKIDAGPMWVWPMRATATAYLGWDPGHYRPRPSTAVHMRAVAEARLKLAPVDLSAWRSERQIRHEHQGWKAKGQLIEHTPDGIWYLPNGREVHVEVELTSKSPERMKTLFAEVMTVALQRGAGVLYLTRGAGVLNTVTRAAREYAKAFGQEWPERLKVADLDGPLNEVVR